MTERPEEGVGAAGSAEELFDPEGSRQAPPLGLDKPQRAGDAAALRRKAVEDKQTELSQENDLRAVLATPEGVRLLARIIGGPCGWNLPHWHASNSVMCEIAGRRSIAYQLEQWISDVDLERWFAVRRELEKLRPKPQKKSGRPERVP